MIIIPKNIVEKTAVVILAAGKGTRLGCTDIPKVMKLLAGKPIVSYVVETLTDMGFTNEHICLVVGFKKEKVTEYFKDRVSYAHQEEQKGTAHAAYTGMKELPKHIDTILVIQGDDSAFYSPETINRFIQEHCDSHAKLSLLSIDVDNPDQLGRIIRHENGDIEVIEKEYITEEQKKIKEISTGTFCFNREWFEHMYPTMPQLRKLGEYALPTALAMARDQGVKWQVIKIENGHEWFGINTPEQLEQAEQMKKGK
ncbi:MAG: NTP transferase domain-containing protein [Candidatus Magasanikbacteria bacterium]|uniref:Nucleotidyl transferase domain-containing protein n=1 Tax=Candidatus Magasanikbacteria bacterium CG10_big_fil_rev_8_21_14_0_10_38_6 TaxID=1974647 RepID=A0A2M6NZW2_9BACT|nr:NTP transferase domain-containing protein [Candidatus Magasanikbacteria bacterium]NCS71807.1 NTP transferase domain-containing protein [Candidatus Magasanikbacteria bacterium]PIR77015.1 MAG: hypothetical protein COU30_04710 [Candidatus Magasanikbacteria bacterium CG10_big_fil_rev_8_21_14_0_10_38_6]